MLVSWASFPLSPDLCQKKTHQAEQRCQARAKARSKVGTLQLQVVQPQTLQRYEQSVHALLDFLIQHGHSYPSTIPALDTLVCLYFEELCENGGPKGWAGCISSRAPKDTWLGGWRLHAAWGRVELPLRVLPFTPLVCALAQESFHRRWEDTFVLLLLGFHRYPRSGEIFQARKADFTFDSKGQVVWSLPVTKSGQLERENP